FFIYTHLSTTTIYTLSLHDALPIYKELVEIIRLNVRTKETEEGLYKLNNIEQTDSVGEFASYSIDATLNGSIKEGELAEVPEGAPDSEDDVEDVVGAEG